MKKIFLTFITALLLHTAYGQEGTVFRAIPFADALAAAAQEGKYVFVDCYTSWCGPCKNMTENIFPQKKVADFFNPQFVSVKYDVEKEEDGIKLAKDFDVTAYPTFLIFRPDGSLVYRIIGGSSEADDFLKKAEEIFEDEKALASLGIIAANGKKLSAGNFTSIGDEKMREALQELLDGATFAEKTSQEYWFMYSTLRLTPKGSANEDFLFDNFETFRRNVGRTEVDKQLGMRFHDLFKDIAWGRLKPSPERLAHLLDRARKADLDPAYNVTAYARLSDALINGGEDTIISVMDEVSPTVGLWTYTIMYDNAAMRGITEQQIEKWVAIAEKVRPTLSKDQEDMLDPMLKGILARREKRIQEAAEQN